MESPPKPTHLAPDARHRDWSIGVQLRPAANTTDAGPVDDFISHSAGEPVAVEHVEDAVHIALAREGNA